MKIHFMKFKAGQTWEIMTELCHKPLLQALLDYDNKEGSDNDICRTISSIPEEPAPADLWDS